MSNTHSMRTATIVAAALTLGGAAPAQDLIPKAPPQTNTVLIRNATIHTVSGGVIENGAIFFTDGVIGGVMSAVELDRRRVQWKSPPVVEIDASGKHVYPGLFGAYTTTGLTEIGSLADTNDSYELGNVTPEVRAAVAINADSTIIPVTRLNGVLTTGVFPSGGVLPGRVSVIRLDGWTWEDMSIEDDAGLVLNWPNMRPVNRWWMNESDEEQTRRRDENLKRIDDVFAAARAYVAAKAADPTVPTDIRWEAMRGALAGEKPVFISAQEYEQIQAAVSWAVEQDVRAIIVGGRDAWLCADLLTRHDIPVIVTGTHRTPGRRDEPYDEPFRLPSMLQNAGIQWCMASSGGASNERNLAYHAATAAAFGLSREDALKSITLWPAQILGVADRVGSLEAGKAATLIVTDGDPLELSTQVEMAFIDGRRVQLRSKQTDLDEKYRQKYRDLGLIPAGE